MGDYTPLECHECGRTVKGARNLQRHLRTMHTPGLAETILRLYNEGVSSPHSCVRGPRPWMVGVKQEETGRRVGVSKSMVRRILVANGINPLARVKFTRSANFTTKFTCPTCGATVRGSNIERHIDAHDTRYFTRYDKEILEMYDAFIPMHKIAKRLDITPYVVRRCLIAHGVERRSVFTYDLGRLSSETIDRTVYLYVNKEMTMREVGRILGISPSGVQHRLVRAGVHLRTRAENDEIYSRRGVLKRKHGVHRSTVPAHGK